MREALSKDAPFSPTTGEWWLLKESRLYRVIAHNAAPDEAPPLVPHLRDKTRSAVSGSVSISEGEQSPKMK